MDSQTLLSSSPSSSNLSSSSTTNDDHVPYPVVRKSVPGYRNGDSGVELVGGTSDAESEDAGFVSADEEVPGQAGSSMVTFNPMVKVSNEDDDGDEEDEEDEEGRDFDDVKFNEEEGENDVFGSSRVKVPPSAVVGYERGKEEELFVSGDVRVGEGEERRVFVGVKLGNSSKEEDEEGDSLVVLLSGEAKKVESTAVDGVVREDSGVRRTELCGDEVVRLENGIGPGAEGADGLMTTNLEEEVVDVSFSAWESSESASHVNREYARDRDTVTVESTMGLPQEVVKMEVESEVAVIPVRESKVGP